MKRNMFVAAKTLSLALLGVLCCSSRSAVATDEAENLPSYTIHVESELTELHVEACFPSEPPSYLSAGSPRAADFLKQIRIDDRMQTDHIVLGEPIGLTNLGSNKCIEYRVDIQAATQSSRRHHYRQRSSDVLLSADSWLWLPPAPGPHQAIELRFVLPPGITISAPWQLIERTQNRVVYRVGQTPHEWPVLMAIGRFKVDFIAVPGAMLRLAVLDGRPPADFDKIRKWVQHGALSVSKLYGRFPIPSPQVLVVPIGKRSEPVPWGQVLRGGGPATQLFIDQTRPLEEFIADWTLVHELSHMVLPYIRHTEPWLYEGIATYYQNVLQARMGTLTERTAWQKLHEGFQRGLRGTNGETTLANASESMHRAGAYMRVYWSGAAVALLADLKLRRHGKSLDQALSKLQSCCLPSSRKWMAEEIMDRLDEVTESRVFSQLYAQHAHADTFPDLAETYRQLGLRVNNSTLHFDDTAPFAHIRTAITQKASE